MSLLFSTLLALSAGNALAVVQSDQLRGEVLSVNADDRELEIQVLEVGSLLEADEGATATYHIPEDVPIDFDIEQRVYRTPASFDFADIRAGDRVVLDFDAMSNWMEVSRFRNEEPSDPTVRERVIATSETVDSEADTTDGEDTTAGEGDMGSDSASESGAGMDDETRTELPASASSLPLFALFGLMFAGLALAVRLTRS
ncbi:MAG: hypothetical protein R3348_09440 [Xanthomonadales bacterium]|nr:hypothetical protein [Xanthomonadales bacterium]